ncbi:hypothetical protein ACFFX0_00415 [Citricoccus parietis]|uniref:Uncharacterized protein n=1 Tax=Citricoccus parietis TaxID=592307 RepID=A0ABV5FSV3_9MICC
MGRVRCPCPPLQEGFPSPHQGPPHARGGRGGASRHGGPRAVHGAYRR